MAKYRLLRSRYYRLLADILIDQRIIPAGIVVKGYEGCTFGTIEPDEKAIVIREFKFLDKFPKYQEFIGIKKAILEKIERMASNEISKV